MKKVVLFALSMASSLVFADSQIAASAEQAAKAANSSVKMVSDAAIKASDKISAAQSQHAQKVASATHHKSKHHKKH